MEADFIPMFEDIQAAFASKARTPKGQRALHAIFSATRAAIIERDLARLSLDRIASRSGLTQAALRHYFPTRDDLLQAFFVTASEWFHGQVEAILANDRIPPRDVLRNCIEWHLSYMEQVETVLWLEASAYWIRQRKPRQVRDEFYRWLTGRYATLIGRSNPSLGARERQRRAYLILTLVLGSWITHGRGSATGPAAAVTARRQLLVDAAINIATS